MKKIIQSLLFFAGLFFMPIGNIFAQTLDGASSPLGVLGLALGAGLAIGIAAHGGAIGQGKAASGALEGIARNPGASGKIFVPMIISLALIESLVIYALLIAFFLYGKI